MKIIDRFSGEYRFLSNFYPCKIVLEPFDQFSIQSNFIECLSLEHAFQAAKAMNPVYSNWIAAAPTPAEAKKRGRVVELRPDWHATRIPLMHTLLEQKFAPSKEELRSRLVATAPALLVEGNGWDDTFWGVSNDKGLNWLGLLLMHVRNNIMEPS